MALSMPLLPCPRIRLRWESTFSRVEYIYFSIFNSSAISIVFFKKRFCFLKRLVPVAHRMLDLFPELGKSLFIFRNKEKRVITKTMAALRLKSDQAVTFSAHCANEAVLIRKRHGTNIMRGAFLKRHILKKP